MPFNRVGNQPLPLTYLNRTLNAAITNELNMQILPKNSMKNKRLNKKRS